MPKIPKPDEASKAFFQSVVPERAGVRVKPMFGNPAAFVNGNMFMGLFGSDLFVRLPDADREAFVKQYKTPAVVLYGALMKEYVEVPDALLARTKEAKKFFDASFRHVSALKPKPTTKAKKKKTG